MSKLREAIESKSELFDYYIRTAKKDTIGKRLLRDKKRWLCHNDLWYLGQITGHNKFIDPFHKDLCDKVSLMNWQIVRLGIQPKHEDMLDIKQVVDKDEELGKFQRLFLLFRSAFKTTIITKLHTAQLLLNFPNIHIAISHNTQINASDNLESVKNLFLTTRLRDLFPEYIPDTKDWGNKSGFSVAARKDFTQNGDNVEAIGIGTEVTGRKYHIFKNDDIVTDKSVTNEEQLKQSRDYLELHKSLFVNPSVRVEDYAGTKYHFADAYSTLQENPDVESLIIPLLDKDGKCAVPELFSPEGIKGLQADSYIWNCNPYEAPILMADFTFKPIGEITAGDEVIGWAKGNNPKRKLVKSRVLTTSPREAKTVIIKFESGREIRCTPDHQWYTAIHEKLGLHKEYKSAKVGSRLMFVVDPKCSNFSNLEMVEKSKWLGGMFDGEGSITFDTLSIAQSKRVHPEVCNEIENTLNLCGFEWSVHKRKSNDLYLYKINGGLKSKIKFLNFCKPVRKNQIINCILKYGAKFISDRDKVVSITPYKKETVYSLQTETGNYIVWGYASKNCQYQLNPTDPTKIRFTNDMIQTFTHIPDGLNYYLVVDPADSEEKRACYTAMKVIGVDNDDNWYWVDGLFDKIDDRERIDEAIRLAKKWRVFEVLWENISFGRTDNRNFERASREVPSKERTWMVREVPASRISKDDRILGLNDRYSRHKIFWAPTLMYYSKFEGKTIDIVKAQEYEFKGFPLVSHKDLLDAESFMLQIDLIKGDKEKTPEPSQFAHIKDPNIRGNTQIVWNDFQTWKENGFGSPENAMAEELY